MERRDFLKLAGAGIVGGLLGGCLPEISGEIDHTTSPITGSESPTATCTPFLPEFPTTAPSPAASETPEPTATQASKELEYAHLFPEGTDLSKTVGPINWAKPVTMVVPPEANPYANSSTAVLEFNFPHPILVTTEASWWDLIPKKKDFGQWRNEEKALVFSGRPSAHPLVLLHSNNTYRKGGRLFPAEGIRKAMEIEKTGKPNPLIGKSFMFEQQQDYSAFYRAKMNVVHMAELTDDDLWQSLFYLNDKNHMFVDYNLAWQPDPNDPSKRIPLFPEEFRGPQHLTVVTCESTNNNHLATIATLRLEKVERVIDPLALFMFGLRQELTV